MAMEPNQYQNTWASIIDLSRRMKNIVDTSRINQNQCFVLSMLGDCTRQYVKWWTKILGKKTMSNLVADRMANELLEVLDHGVQLIHFCCTDQPSIVFKLDCKGEFSEIIDDAIVYVHMLNRSLTLSTDSEKGSIDKLSFKVNSDLKSLRSSLEWAHQTDKKTLIDSLKHKSGRWLLRSNIPFTSMLQILETGSDVTQPNINDTDLSAKKKFGGGNINDTDLSAKKELGGGNFGYVVSALWHEVPVAVKVFSSVQDFQNELKVFEKLLQVDCPHIVQMLGHTNGNNLVLELMDANLEELMAKNKYNSSSSLLILSVDMMLQIAKAIRHLHNIDVAHGNLKPSNVLMKFGKNGNLLIKLSDFGISQVRNIDMTPKMLDVYSFGLICREILIFPGYYHSKKREGEELPLRIPKELDSLILSCMQCAENKKTPGFDFEDICNTLWRVKEQVLSQQDICDSLWLPKEEFFTNKGMPGKGKGRMTSGDTGTIEQMPPTKGHVVHSVHRSTWDSDIIVLCRKINEAALTRRVNQRQCLVISSLADQIRKCVQQWTTLAKSDSAANLGKELFAVLERGLQLINICDRRRDLSATAFIILGSKGQFGEIIEDAMRYAQIIDRLTDYSTHSFVSKHQLSTQLQMAWKDDKDFFQREPGILGSNIWVSSLLQMLETIKFPNIKDSDLCPNEILGEGGLVTSALWDGALVAVKYPYSTRELTAHEKLLQNHSPHIVQMLGHTTERKLVLEFMDQNLKQLIQSSNRKLSLIQLVDVMLQIAKAIRHLHSVDVIHRKIKPANILVTVRTDGSLFIKVADLNRAILDLSHRGFAPFEEPELVGLENCSKEWDVYSFGLVCAQILMWDLGRQKVLQKVRALWKKGQVIQEGIPEMLEGIPEMLESLVLSCMKYNSLGRPSFQRICDSLWRIKEELLT